MEKIVNTFSSIFQDYNETFIKKNLIRVIKVSWICSLIFTFQIVILSFLYPYLWKMSFMFILFAISLTIAYILSKKNYKHSFNIATIILFVSDFIFINSLILFGEFGVMAIYNPAINFVFMMFIVFTVFTPNTTSAILHSFSYSFCAIGYYLYNFNTAKQVLNQSWYRISEPSLFGFSLAYLMTATIVSLYVWYRDNKSTNLRNIVYKNLVTSVHEKLLASEEVENKYWHVLTAIINIQDDFFGGDFIAYKQGNNYIELFIGDVMDHGIDTSQIAFGLLSIFHSEDHRHPEKILLNCHTYLKKIGDDLGGLSYISIIRLYNNGLVQTYGSTGVQNQLISNNKINQLNTKNIVFGSKNIELKNIHPYEFQAKNSDMLIVKTDGWTSEFDEKSSIIATFNGN
jgi:hypothetical protein